MVATVKEERREVAVVSLSHKACVWGPRLWGLLFLHVSARNPMGLAANPVQNFVLAAICLAVLRMQQVGNHSGMLKGYKTRGFEARCAVWLVCPVPRRCRSQPSLTGKCSLDRACDSVCSHSGAVSQTFSHHLPSALPCLRPKCHMHVSHGSGCLLLQSPIIRALKTPQREESAGSVDLLHPLTHARLCQYRISMPVEPSAACQVEVEWRSKGCRRDTDNSESQRGISKYRCALDASSRRSLERDISILIQIKDRMTRG